MVDSGYETIVIGDGALTAAGEPGNFTITLASPLMLGRGKWEACLLSVAFKSPMTDTPPGYPVPAKPASCFVLLNICDTSTVGSDEVALLYLTQPISAGTADPVYIQHTSSIGQWKPVIPGNYGVLRVTIQTSTGALIPPTDAAGTPVHTTLQFVVRQVSDVS